MFSIEKNYIKEQKKIIESLEKAIEQKESENIELKSNIEGLENKLSSLEDTITEKKKDLIGDDIKDISTEGSPQNIEEKDEGDAPNLNLSDVDSQDDISPDFDETPKKEEYIGKEEANYEEEWGDSSSVESNSISDGEAHKEIIDEDIKYEGETEDEVDKESKHLPVDVPKVYELYIPEDILHQLKEFNLENYYEGKKKDVLILSIRLFDFVSSNLTDKAYLKLYNKIFNQLSVAIYRHSGFIRSYSVESIDVLFGLFDQDDEGTYGVQAISCFKEIKKKIAIINSYLEKKALNQLDYTAVAHRGEIIVGKVGEKDNLIFTGDDLRLVDAIASLSYIDNYSFICSYPTYKLINEEIVLNAIDNADFTRLGKTIKLFAI